VSGGAHGPASGRVFVLGSLNRDLLIPVPHPPAPGETVLGGDARTLFGGKGANQAVAAAVAGASTAMIGAVGDDEAGRAYRARLEAFGIRTSALRTVAGVPTGVAVVCLDPQGDNLIVVSPGANTRVGRPELDALEVLGAGDVLLMPMEIDPEVAVAALRAGAARGARVVLNLAPFTPLPAEVLQLADPVIVNETEAQQLARSGLRAPSLLTTLGPRGARWGDLAVAAAPATVVDTTGAGDAFAGTLAAALALGADPEAAMAAAARGAAAAVSRLGAQPEPDDPAERPGEAGNSLS